MSMTASEPASAESRLVKTIAIIGLFDRIPYRLVALTARIALAQVFWSAAQALFGMILVIEIFVFPEAWPPHIQWTALQLVLMGHGAGSLSLDTALRGWFKRPV